MEDTDIYAFSLSLFVFIPKKKNLNIAVFKGIKIVIFSIFLIFSNAVSTIEKPKQIICLLPIFSLFPLISIVSKTTQNASIPHILSCCDKYSVVCINAQKIVPNKDTFDHNTNYRALLYHWC